MKDELGRMTDKEGRYDTLKRLQWMGAVFCLLALALTIYAYFFSPQEGTNIFILKTAEEQFGAYMIAGLFGLMGAVCFAGVAGAGDGKNRR